MREFLATERCDRCGAQAYHAATKPDTELMFCNHHYTRFRDKLLDEYWVVESDIANTEALVAVTTES